jgi:prophage DNA circulation protein
MTWKAKAGPAKFRGVPFHAKATDHGTGRRGPVFQFPYKSTPHKDDLGRSARSFRVEGYVVGDDYLEQRDRLLAALETEGPGELIHPYYGTRRVAVGEDVSVRESDDEGGMATFSIPFIEVAEPSQPAAVVDAAAKVEESSAAARAATGEQFIARYVTDATYKDSAAGMLRSAALEIDQQISRAGMAAQELATMKRRVDRLYDSAETLVNSPEDMLSDLTDIFDGVDSTEALLKTYEFDAGIRPPATTSNREDEQTNFDQTNRLIQRLAAIRAVELAPSRTFESYDEALAARNTLTDLLDEQMEDAPDDVFPSLLQLRSDLVKAVPGDSSDLPRLLEHSQPFSVPSLVLAHTLYGNVDLELDLVARNKIKHPGFVFGDLEVLSDD